VLGSRFECLFSMTLLPGGARGDYAAQNRPEVAQAVAGPVISLVGLDSIKPRSASGAHDGEEGGAC